MAQRTSVRSRRKRTPLRAAPTPVIRISAWRRRPASDPWLIPEGQRRQPAPLAYGVLPEIVVLCGRPRDGVPCSGVIYQMECYVCGSRDTTHRQAYRRAGADALAAVTDKMSERRR